MGLDILQYLFLPSDINNCLLSKVSSVPRVFSQVMRNNGFGCWVLREFSLLLTRPTFVNRRGWRVFFSLRGVEGVLLPEVSSWAGLNS